MKSRGRAGLKPFAKLPKTFEGLCRLLPPRPIHDESDYDNAIEVLDALVGHKLSKDQADYVEAMTTLVGAYEDLHHAVDLTNGKPTETLRYLLDQNQMTASDLGELLGNRSLGSKILRGERELSKAHLRTLAQRFKVNAGLFL